MQGAFLQRRVALVRDAERLGEVPDRDRRLQRRGGRRTRWLGERGRGQGRPTVAAAGCAIRERLHACTIIARNYLHFARVLARSFHEHHPGGRFSVLVIDDRERSLDAGDELFDLVRIDEIGLGDIDRMAGIYDVLEFSTAVKPWLLRHLLSTGDEGAVLY